MITLITVMTLMPIDYSEERRYVLSPGRRLQARTVERERCGLLALIQHEVSIAEEMLGEVKLVVTGYRGAKKAPGDKMIRRFSVFLLYYDQMTLLALPQLPSCHASLFRGCAIDIVTETGWHWIRAKRKDDMYREGFFGKSSLLILFILFGRQSV